MSAARKLRILITGFGPFPGAPFNPTPALVRRLLRLRRPALADVELVGHVFEVTYRAVDRDLPLLLARHQPDALLMFGLAARTRHVRIETRARNAVSMLWPDAGHVKLRTASIAEGAEAQMFGPHTTRLLRAALSTGIDARLSRDAGRYLCNYLSWRVLEAAATGHGPRLAAFVHVPLVPRQAGPRIATIHGKITAEQLVMVGEAVLLEKVRLTRRRAIGA